MTENRFSDPMPNEMTPAMPSGFLVMPAPANDAAPTLLQWLYQQMYERAQQASQPPRLRDLFAIMN